MSVENQIVWHLENSDDVVFLRSEFSPYGSTSQVGRALKKLVVAGTLARVSLGAYAKTRRNKFSGKMTPDGTLESISAQLLAKLKVDVFPGTLSFEYNTGRSTQVPVTAVVWTGQRRIRRTITVGARTLQYEQGNFYDDTYLSIAEVAARLDVSRPYALMLCDGGKLGKAETTKNGQRRIRASAVEAYLNLGIQQSKGSPSPRDAGIEAGLYDYPDGHFANRTRESNTKF